MNKIYTSYYGNRKIDPDKYYLVQISNSKPSYYKVDADVKFLHPDWRIVSDHKAGRITDADYKYEYLEQLYSNEKLILNTLVHIKNVAKKDVVLLCYEKPGDFCHRHILTEWFNDVATKNRNYKDIRIEGEL